MKAMASIYNRKKRGYGTKSTPNYYEILHNSKNLLGLHKFDLSNSPIKTPVIRVSEFIDLNN